jgi:xylulokinase
MSAGAGTANRGRFLLGIDIGTFSSKGVLVREDGEVAAERMVEHSLDIPSAGRAEHDPEKVWWADFTRICADLLAASGVKPAAIAAIGISTISPAVVAVDSDGRTLRPAILYGIDTRATEEIAELSAATGVSLDSQSACPKVMWIRRHEPEVWARTRWILNGSGWLNLRLTGERTIDIYDASIFHPFYDAISGGWSKEISPLVAPLEMMPQPTWTSRVMGQVTAEAARETGLASGTPVITGTADAAAEAVAAGLSGPGDMMVMYGSSTFFILRTEGLRSPRGFWASRFLEEGTFVVAGGTSTAGSLTRWFRDNFCPSELAAERAGGANAYASLSRLADESVPGSRGVVVLPYFSGERTPLNDPDARGVIFGLSLGHTRADVYRAVLESVGYSIRHNIEALRAEDCRASRILAVGGGTRNPAWMQIVSDIAGIEQVVPARQIGASYGDAFLAGIGVGLFSGTADAQRWVHTGATIRPNEKNRAVYDAGYGLYRELYEQTKDSMKKSAAIAQM